MDEKALRVRERELKIPEYRESVDALFKNKSSRLIANSSVLHAAVINEMMIKYTPDNGKVFIFCKDLAKDCFDHPAVIRELKFALQRGIKFFISHTIEPMATEFLAILNAKKNEKCTEQVFIRKVRPMQVNGKEINFSTNEYAVRLELDASETTAQVIPYSPDNASVIVELYSKLQEDCNSENE